MMSKTTVEELEAVRDYEKRKAKTSDNEVASILDHHIKEEIEHAVMNFEWFRRHFNLWTNLMDEWMFSTKETHINASYLEILNRLINNLYVIEEIVKGAPTSAFDFVRYIVIHLEYLRRTHPMWAKMITEFIDSDTPITEYEV